MWGWEIIYTYHWTSQSLAVSGLEEESMRKLKNVSDRRAPRRQWILLCSEYKTLLLFVFVTKVLKQQHCIYKAKNGDFLQVLLNIRSIDCWDNGRQILRTSLEVFPAYMMPPMLTWNEELLKQPSRKCVLKRKVLIILVLIYWARK